MNDKATANTFYFHSMSTLGITFKNFLIDISCDLVAFHCYSFTSSNARNMPLESFCVTGDFNVDKIV